MKKVLIISPYFPPVNAADMHRVRTSLPYYQDFGWDAEIVTVDARYSDLPTDDLLLESIPAGLKVHCVKAFNKKWTSKLGLGSIALRSLWFYKREVNTLLKTGNYDLVYFSTTQFPVCVLGAYWNKKFKIPYVIDMQDPWHSDYYLDKPKAEQPAKYWFSYRLNKYLEPVAMKTADGLIAVSEQYISDLKSRYPKIRNRPVATITFGAFEPDLTIAGKNKGIFKSLLDPAYFNIVYVGRGGADLHKAITPFFKTILELKNTMPEAAAKIRIHFIGTSYAPNGQGKPSIMPLARVFQLEEQVMELTDRISYYHTLATLQSADALFVPGSDDAKYTASKIYPYVLSRKPMLAIFHPDSSAISITRELGINSVYDYESVTTTVIAGFLQKLLTGVLTPPQLNADALHKHSAQTKTQTQCQLFNQVIDQWGN